MKVVDYVPEVEAGIIQEPQVVELAVESTIESSIQEVEVRSSNRSGRVPKSTKDDSFMRHRINPYSRG